jgi:hypothetical protein
MTAVSSIIFVLIMATGWGVAGARAQAPGDGASQTQKQGDQASPAPSTASGLSGTGAVAREGDEEVRPLPDIPALMHEVEEHEKTAEAVQKDYLYHAADTVEELDGHGGVKKTEAREYDVFWVEGVPVHKLTKKKGMELNADQQKKEGERIDKEVARARERRVKADAEGKTTDPYGHEEVTVSRLLELGSFSNARRVILNGRETIAVDYVGDPKAKTRNRLENVIRDIAGTVWVDEEDRAISKLEGRFLDTFKIGAGLVVNIQKGTSFSMEQRKVNGEVWLPAQMDGQGAARAFLLFRFNGRFREVDSGYRKFKVTSTILPGMGKPSQ